MPACFVAMKLRFLFKGTWYVDLSSFLAGVSERPPTAKVAAGGAGAAMLRAAAAGTGRVASAEADPAAAT